MNDKIKSIFFYIGTICFMIHAMCYRIELFNIVEWIRIIGGVCLLVKIGADMLTITNKQRIFVAISLVVGTLTFVLTKRTMILSFLLIICAAKKIDIKKYLKIDLIFRICAFALVIILSKTGVIDNRIIYRGNEIRQSLGFSHPNELAMHVMLLSLQLFALANFKFKWYNLLSVPITIYMLFSICNSRTSLIVYVLSLLALALDKLLQYQVLSKIKYKVLNLSFISVALITLFFGYMYFYDINIILKVNYFLMGRLDNIVLFAQTYGIKLFASEANYLLELNTLDNLYANIVILYGIIPFLLIVYIFYIGFKKMNNKIDSPYLIILSILCLYGISENTWLVGGMTAFVSILGIFFHKESIGEKEVIIDEE